MNHGLSIAAVEALSDTLFLTGRLDPTHTYLIAYHAGIITGTTDPGTKPLRVHPDPAVDRIWISGAPARAVTVRVLDGQGRSVLQQPTRGAADLELQVAMLAPGLYTVLVEGPDVRMTQRFVRAR